jgi:hypothetical protein
MVIERDRKYQANYNQTRHNGFIARPNHHQPDDADCQDYELSGHDIGEDRANKESFFALKKGAAVWAMMS